ncbi:MAG: hypothetical protein IPM16_08725 [Chloroflexi bacterium]|nr:hypothetical protein [Chloroflexota bacterium]
MAGEKSRDLIDRVQEHERAWGNEGYPDRPSLADVLNAPVVAFWHVVKAGKPAERQIITLHEDLSTLEQWYVKAVMRSAVALPDRLLAAAYLDGRRVRIKDVTVTFEVEDDSRSKGTRRL